MQARQQKMSSPLVLDADRVQSGLPDRSIADCRAANTVVKTTRPAYPAMSQSSPDTFPAKEAALVRLAGRLSHRLNNILAVMVGNTAFLREVGSLSGQQVAALTDLEAACETAIELAGHLQSFAGNAGSNPEFVDLRSVVVRTTATLKGAFQGMTLHTTLPAEPCIVALDHAQAVRVLTELMQNARAAKSMRLWIEVSIQLVETGLQALLRVRDDGEGMPAPVLARATEPMFTTRAESAGWGLSLLEGFVRQSGGQIRIASSPGLGTQVEIWLPVVDPARSAAPDP